MRHVMGGLVAFVILWAAPARAKCESARWQEARERLTRDLADLVVAVEANEPSAPLVDRTLGRLFDLNVRVVNESEKIRRKALDFVITGAVNDVIGATATEARRRTLWRVLTTLETRADFARDGVMKRLLRAKTVRLGLYAATIGLTGTYAFEIANAFVDWRLAWSACPAEVPTVKVALAAATSCDYTDLLAAFVARNVVAAATVWGVLRVPGRRRLSVNHVGSTLRACERTLALAEAGGPLP